MSPILFDRKEAGSRLATELAQYANNPQGLVLGLPRGGIPVAHEIAKQLNLVLDVCLVKKLGLPQNPEIAMGAVAEDALVPDYNGNITIIEENTTQTHDIRPAVISAIAARVKAELRWRDRCYRHYRPLATIKDKIVILVDDGIATGLTMQAAVEAVQKRQPAKIIIATPIISEDAKQKLEPQVAEIVCLSAPQYLQAVSLWYRYFPQVSDEEVCQLLSESTQVSSPHKKFPVRSSLYA